MAIRDIQLPSYYEDPYYKPSQEYLCPYGQAWMEGDISEYYRPIGEWGGPELEDLIRLTTRDITQRGLEAGAKANIRGPRLSASISKAIADVVPGMRYEDYSRGLEGRKWLFGQGRGITEDVRTAGLTAQEQRNAFNRWLTEMQFEIERAGEAKTAAKKARESAMWSQILSSVIGTGANITGMGMLSSAIRGSATGVGQIGRAIDWKSGLMDILS